MEIVGAENELKENGVVAIGGVEGEWWCRRRMSVIVTSTQ